MAEISAVSAHGRVASAACFPLVGAQPAHHFAEWDSIKRKNQLRACVCDTNPAACWFTCIQRMNKIFDDICAAAGALKSGEGFEPVLTTDLPYRTISITSNASLLTDRFPTQLREQRMCAVTPFENWMIPCPLGSSRAIFPSMIESPSGRCAETPRRRCIAIESQDKIEVMAGGVEERPVAVNNQRPERTQLAAINDLFHLIEAGIPTPIGA